MLHEQQKKALKAAFPHTVPILTGFLFLGFAYGIYMHSAGLSVVYTFFMASLIYGGSLELLAVGFLLGPFAPLETLFLAIMIQLRHLFYGIAMLDKFPKNGWKRFYLIFGMCDESFSINYSTKIPEGGGSRLVYVFCDTLKSNLLGARLLPWYASWECPALFHRGD